MSTSNAPGQQLGDSSSAADRDSQPEARTVPPTPTPDIADRPAVPGYEILSELGRGGMGVVYQARQVALNRVVALKMVLAGGHAGEADLARFRTEAEAIARLQHPHIVQIHEVGESGGLPFFALEYCAGGSWEKKLGGTPLPAREAARLIEALAGAVQAAHQAGIVHRDLKPANILLASGGCQPPVGAESTGGLHPPLAGYIPKITDFGLAKKLDVSAGPTASGAIMGTPSYMAPEQAGGQSKEVGPAADVYALGAILYECLTGRPPFRAATQLDTLLQVLSEDPVPPSRLQPQVPRDLETICLKCLEKEPRKRYASAEALAADLRCYLAGEPVRARPVRGWERGWKWARRRPAAAALLSVTVLLLLTLVGGGVSLFYSGRLQGALGEAERQRDIAEEQRQIAEEQHARAVEASKEADRQRERAEGLVYARQIALAQAAWQEGDVRRAWVLLDGCRRDLRGWEHDYLYTLFTSKQHTLHGHKGAATSVAFSPDGKRLASAGADGIVKVWEALTGQEILTIKEAGGLIAYSPDGKRLLSGSGDKTAKVWDAQTGQLTHTLNGHAEAVTSVAVSLDGKRLASASMDNTLKVWNAQTGQEIHTLFGHTGAVRSVAFSPDGKRLASGSTDLHVNLWDVQTGQLVLTLEGHTGFVECVAFSPDGKRLASGSADIGVGPGEIKVWDAQTGQQTLSLQGHTDGVTSVAFSPDGRRLLSGGEDKTVKLWDAQTGQLTRSLPGHSDRVRSVAFSPDGHRLASASEDSTVKVWNAQAGENPLTLEGDIPQVCSVAFSSDGKRLLSGGEDSTVKVWDVQTGQLTRTLKGHTWKVNSVVFSADGRRLASGSGEVGIGPGELVERGGEIKVWDGETGRLALSLKGHTGAVLSVALSPDGTCLVSGGDSVGKGESVLGEVKVWDARTGQLTRSLQGLTSPVYSVAFSPDGQLLVSGEFEGTVKVWDAQTGRLTRSFQGHVGPVYSVVFSPDGKRLLSGSDDQTVKVWDLHTGQETLSLQGHTGPVHSVAFSPDGKRLVSGSEQASGAHKPGEIKVWDAQTGQELLTLKGHRGAVYSAAVSPDGKRLASASADGTIKLWDATRCAP
jgi:WD40 repeat protein